jgi:hypothetical protein
MSLNAAKYDATLQRRVVYDMVLQFQDTTDVNMDLTGWTVASQIWNLNRTTQYATFAVNYVDRVNGKVTLSLTSDQTATLPDKCYYDVLLTSPSNRKEYYLEGALYVLEGYTT